MKHSSCQHRMWNLNVESIFCTVLAGIWKLDLAGSGGFIYICSDLFWIVMEFRYKIFSYGEQHIVESLEIGHLSSWHGQKWIRNVWMDERIRRYLTDPFRYSKRWKSNDRTLEMLTQARQKIRRKYFIKDDVKFFVRSQKFLKFFVLKHFLRVIYTHFNDEQVHCQRIHVPEVEYIWRSVTWKLTNFYLKFTWDASEKSPPKTWNSVMIISCLLGWGFEQGNGVITVISCPASSKLSTIEFPIL